MTETTEKAKGVTAIGVVLSNASTYRAIFQFFEGMSRSVYSNFLVIVHRKRDNTKILARIGQITPYHGFFGKGDIWSEARKKRVTLPYGIASKYTTAELDLIREVPSQQPIMFPPEPGDDVYLIDEIIRKLNIINNVL